MNNISFTGHRVIGITPELRAALQETIENFIEKGAVNFYAGGAIGFDTLCAETVLGLRQKYPQIRLCLLLPCPPDEQTSRWQTNQKEKYREILSQADETEVCSEKYFNGCMKIRNARLVEKADAVICCCQNALSGTGQTVEMARRKGIEVVNLISFADCKANICFAYAPSAGTNYP